MIKEIGAVLIEVSLLAVCLVGIGDSFADGETYTSAEVQQWQK